MEWDESKMQESMTHMKEHVTYPATKADIVSACNNMEHLTAEEKNMSNMLPEKTYNNVDEVMDAFKAM